MSFTRESPIRCDIYDEPNAEALGARVENMIKIMQYLNHLRHSSGMPPERHPAAAASTSIHGHSRENTSSPQQQFSSTSVSRVVRIPLSEHTIEHGYSSIVFIE